MSNERDLQLLHRIVERDRASFTELYLRYRPSLARFLKRRISRHDLIEDVINETLWIVWDRCAGFRGASRVSTWIFGICYRCALLMMRKSRPHVPLLESEAPSSPDVLPAIEDGQWLEHALAELPHEQRTALELFCVGGHSCEEIAAIMQCAVGTVKTRMFRARTGLHRSLPRLARAESRRHPRNFGVACGY